MARTKKAQVKAPAKKPTAKPVQQSALGSDTDEELEGSAPLASSTAHVSSFETIFGSFLILLLQQGTIDTTAVETEAERTDNEDEEDEVAEPVPPPPRRVRRQKQSRSKRADLVFPVGRIHRTLKESHLADRVSIG
jgi:hypothetical protein